MFTLTIDPLYRGAEVSRWVLLDVAGAPVVVDVAPSAQEAAQRARRAAKALAGPGAKVSRARRGSSGSSGPRRR
jgi:hypothetical protein